MKRIKIICWTLCLSMMTIQCAQAGSMRSSGSSSSFKSGFSSQKRSSLGGSSSTSNRNTSFGSSKEAAAPAPSAAPKSADTSSSGSTGGKKPLFGSFGSFGKSSASVPPAAPTSTSALSKDLDKTAANANALKTLDVRKNTNVTGAATNNTGAAASPVAAAGASGFPAQPTYHPAPQTVIVQQRDSGFFSSPFLWYMMGSSMSNHSGGYSNNYPNNPANNSANNGGNSQNGSVAQMQMPGSSEVPLVQRESIGMSLLRIFLWLFILSALGWLIYFFVKRTKGKTRASANYSFGKT